MAFVAASVAVLPGFVRGLATGFVADVAVEFVTVEFVVAEFVVADLRSANGNA